MPAIVSCVSRDSEVIFISNTSWNISKMFQIKKNVSNSWPNLSVSLFEEKLLKNKRLKRNQSCYSTRTL